MKLLKWVKICSQVAAFNAKVAAELHNEDESSIKWTDTSTQPPVIVGEPVSTIIAFRSSFQCFFFITFTSFSSFSK